MTKKELPLKVFLLAVAGLMAPVAISASPGTESAMAQSSRENNFVAGGIVTDSNGDPLLGVSVLVVGSNAGTTTGLDGEFKINVKKNDRLRFSYVGYNTVEMTASENMKVEMSEDNRLLSEVIVTGVAKGTSREKLAFNVEKVQNSALKEVTGTSVASTLAGKMPGIKVLPTTGNPNDEPIIQLRGALSFASTGQPLIIVDGIVTSGSLNDINMEDVENIEVIKGAAAASFYGSKAAAGVISITTKRGSSLENGKIDVTFKSEVGTSWV